jgi:DNA (cytosine-5)-methyltransferase 1
MNINIFDLLYENIKLTPPIKMFEAFSGIGTQAMALKQLSVPYEIVGFSEIDKYAIQSYHAIHGDEIKNYGDITKMNEIPSCDIFTWSFPCTDLSKAGKRQGMSKDTRSGLVYDVLRLVRDTKDKPKVLIMENVPDLIQTTFIKQFGEIQYELETYGYTNYVETLNSKDFGVAQNRNRVFMVSVLGEYNYNFPQPFKLEKRLKDYLEQDVDEKYYLNTQTIERISKWNAQQDPLENMERIDQTGITPTLTARGAGEEHSGMILIKETNNKRLNETIKEIKDNDTQFLDAYNRSIHKDITPTITTRIDASNSSFLYNDLRIRKLTPRETWRLMGCSDDDFDKAQKVCSNSQLYKQAGNAIVVDVFREILINLI